MGCRPRLAAAAPALQTCSYTKMDMRMSPETHKPAAADKRHPMLDRWRKHKAQEAHQQRRPRRKSNQLKERRAAHRDTQKPSSSNTISPAMPPQARRKSPSCSSLRSGCAGEWSLATMSMVPFCAHSDAQLRFVGTPLLHLRLKAGTLRWRQQPAPASGVWLPCQ